MALTLSPVEMIASFLQLKASLFTYALTVFIILSAVVVRTLLRGRSLLDWVLGRSSREDSTDGASIAPYLFCIQLEFPTVLPQALMSGTNASMLQQLQGIQQVMEGGDTGPPNMLFTAAALTVLNNNLQQVVQTEMAKSGSFNWNTVVKANGNGFIAGTSGGGASKPVITITRLYTNGPTKPIILSSDFITTLQKQIAACWNDQVYVTYVKDDNDVNTGVPMSKAVFSRLSSFTASFSHTTER